MFVVEGCLCVEFVVVIVFDLIVNVVKVVCLFFCYIEVWFDIVLLELCIVVEYDMVGCYGLEYVGKW